MGWKASLVIIENKNNFSDEKALLNAIGKSDYKFNSEVSLEACIYPQDESINIGFYNGNIIICDDYQITTDALESADNLDLTKEEKALVDLFPTSEIMSVACLSTVNFHAYSLIDAGVKKRLKICVEEHLIEFGDRFEEEKAIYSKSINKNGENYWVYDDDEYSEAELMEDFTFGVAKRRLGIKLDDMTGDELMEKVVFKKYLKVKQHTTPKTPPVIKEERPKWIKYAIIFALFVLWQVIKRTFFYN